MHRDINLYNSSDIENFYFPHFMLSIKSKQLRHLVILSEEKNFSRASVRAHISQSALSRSIQSIEEELDIKIFDRTARGVILTRAGRVIVQHAHRLLSEVDCLMVDVESLKAIEYIGVTIGMEPYCEDMLLPKLLGNIIKEHPEIRVKIEVSDCKSLAEKLLENKIDLAVTNQHELSLNSRISTKQLPSVSVALYVRPGHPLLLRSGISIGDLINYPLISAPIEESMRELIGRSIDLPRGEYFRPLAQCTNVSTLRALANHTDAILLLVAPEFKELLWGGDFIRLGAIGGKSIEIEFFIGYSAGSILSDEAITIISIMQNIMSNY